ncbi:MAG: hypothetical protein AAB948_01870, partial [Patescibacteria group bacterium]
MKFYSNKFLISFLILTVLLYSFSVKVAEAKGVLNVISHIIVYVVVAIVSVLACSGPQVYACVALMEGIIGGVFAAGFVACQAGSDNPLWSGCNKGGSSSSSGTPGSPTLTSQTATPIVQNSCTTGFIL